MAIKKWADWLDDVMPSLPGAATAIAEDAIRSAAIEFCTRSKRLRADMDEFMTTAGESLYDLDASSGYEVVEIAAVTLDGKPIDPVSPAILDRDATTWRSDSGNPAGFFLVEPNQMRLVATPDAAYPVLATLVYRPLKAATGIDVSVFNGYREAIASGALKRLLLLPRKPWTDAGLAAVHAQHFEDGIRRAEAWVAKQGTRMPLRSRAWGTA